MSNKIILGFSIFFTLSIYAQDKDVFDIARRKGTLTQKKSICKSNPELMNPVNGAKLFPLILACCKGNVDVTLFVIEKSSNLNYVFPEVSALMATVMPGKTTILRKVNLNLTETSLNTLLQHTDKFLTSNT